MVNKKRYAPSLQNEEKLKHFINGKHENNGINFGSLKRCSGNCGCGGSCGKEDNTTKHG